MAGPLPAPDPPPQTTSAHLLQATNPLTLSSSNQIQQNPPTSLLRPSDSSVRWSDPAASSSDPRPPLLHPPEPAVPAPVLALPALINASAPACPSPELAPPSPAISVSAPASAPPQLPAAPDPPDPPPAVPPESAAGFPPLSSSLPTSPPLAEAPLSALHTDLQKCPPPVRRNAQVNPPHLKSYAQAAKGAPGPGFVRAHARDVDSFARLPRTGINVICGTREGIPVFSLGQSDMHKVEGLYAKALVMKFHGGRPSLAASHKEISCWGLESSFSIGPLTSRSFLLRFQDERDLLKILTRPSSTLISFPYKIFRWHSRCHKNEDSATVPVWISLPRLPLQCFAPEFLESIANRIGRFLCLDKATATLARPSTARICIELDLRKARPQCVLIDLFEGHRQPIVYERLPKFCMGCHVQGHTNVECSKSSLDTLQSHNSGPNPTVQECLQHVRRNAKELFSVVSQGLNTQSAPTPLPQDDAPPHRPKASAATPLLPLENILQSPASSVAATAVLLPALDPQQATHDHSHQQLLPPTISPAVISSEQQLSGPISSKAEVQNAKNNSAAVSQVNLHQSLSAKAAPFSPSDQVPPMQQTLKSTSVKPHFPAIKLMPSPRSSTVRAKAAVVSAPVPPSHQPSLNQNPSPSPARSRSKQHKSDPVYTSAFEEPPDPSYPFESDSGDSVEANSPIGAHSAIAQEVGNSFPQSYASEGEEFNVEPITLQGHISDDAFYQRPKSSKRNKRHPDGPLKVQLRARKGSSSILR